MTWAIHHRELWHDLQALEMPTNAGRRLDVGGFILADPFDQLLREISGNYLLNAWSKVTKILEAFRIRPDDLTWGFLHPGETFVSGRRQPYPSDFTGWTSPQLATFYEDERFQEVDKSLAARQPMIRFVFTWRSNKWRINPDDFPTALRLLEALWTDEYADWNPDYLLQEDSPHDEPWLNVARAIQHDDQRQLDKALAIAGAHYTPLGFKIMRRGFASYVEAWKEAEAKHSISL